MLTYRVMSERLNEIKPLDEEMVCAEIERIATGFALTVTERTTLSTKKGSYHWHFKKGQEKGVLEITYWPKRGEVLIEIHDNRRTEWNMAMIEPMAKAYADYFDGTIQN